MKIGSKDINGDHYIDEEYVECHNSVSETDSYMNNQNKNVQLLTAFSSRKTKEMDMSRDEDEEEINYSSTARSLRRLLHALATEVEDEAEDLEHDTQSFICDVRAAEAVTKVFKEIFESTAKYAEKMADHVNISDASKRFYEGIAAVSALCAPTMGNLYEEEEELADAAKVVEQELEKIAADAEKVRQATGDQQNLSSKQSQSATRKRRKGKKPVMSA